jgi:uncharacterized phage infection (PIP) family protein YhgE
MWPAIIAAAASLGSAALSNKGSKDRNKKQIQQAREQMAFQERMSNTAVARRMADLKASGINPILAGQLSASSPAGAMAQIENELTPAVNSALSAAQTSAQFRNLAAQTKQTNAQARITSLTANRLAKKPHLIDAQYGPVGGIESVKDAATSAAESVYEKIAPEMARAIDAAVETAKNSQNKDLRDYVVEMIQLSRGKKAPQQQNEWPPTIEWKETPQRIRE